MHYSNKTILLQFTRNTAI